MNLGTIIRATPWLRRLWRLTPGPLRIPIALVALLVGAWRLGRRQQAQVDETTSR